MDLSMMYFSKTFLDSIRSISSLCLKDLNDIVDGRLDTSSSRKQPVLFTLGSLLIDPEGF